MKVYQRCNLKLQPQSRRYYSGLSDFITLTEVTVSSYEITGNSGAALDATDHFALHFAKIEFKSAQQKPDGTLGDSTQAGWDLKNAKPA